MRLYDKYKSYVPRTIVGILIQNFIFSSSTKLYLGLVGCLISSVLVALLCGDEYETKHIVLVLCCSSPALYIGIKFFVYGLFINPINIFYNKYIKK